MAGGEADELSDVVGVELVEGGDAEESHGALDLAAEDLDGAVHALAAAGHQAVEVGAADEGEVGAVGDRGDDVLAGADAGVQVRVEQSDYELSPPGQCTAKLAAHPTSRTPLRPDRERPHLPR